MNKEEFLKKLTEELSHIPPEEIVKAIGYYKESIEDRVDDGMSEEEAVRSLGNFDEIIKNIEEEVPLGSVVKDKFKKKVNDSKESNLGKKALLAIMVIFTSPIWITILAVLISIILGFYIGIWGLFIGVIATYFGLIVASFVVGVYGIIALFTEGFLIGLLLVGVGLILLGIAIAFALPMFWIIKEWVKLNLLPFKKLKKMIMKKEKVVA